MLEMCKVPSGMMMIQMHQKNPSLGLRDQQKPQTKESVAQAKDQVKDRDEGWTYLYNIVVVRF